MLMKQIWHGSNNVSILRSPDCLFPLRFEAIHTNVMNRVDHFLTCIKLRNIVSIHLVFESLSSWVIILKLFKTSLDCALVSWSEFCVRYWIKLMNILLLQYIDKTGFRACVKELYEAKYDPFSVTYSVLMSGKCSASKREVWKELKGLGNFSIWKLSQYQK